MKMSFLFGRVYFFLPFLRGEDIIIDDDTHKHITHR